MKVEKILKQVPIFKDLTLDGNEVYLFSRCLVNAKVVKWIGTKTNYETLIQLLQDKITIREAFLNVTKDKIIIEYDGKNVQYKTFDKELVLYIHF